ncbi:hypothetical protein [Oryzicola mucosus]|uniref:Uncharacterized protein n=1 Tax=Oryzicola mucosus TaxID=2767425 RepID=A0A8J6PN77_9HYPH|nr:hypothetical protein [Oryzicola mucosus]MBD0417483.1 hypothetical protein [Oryzicola mucosus]
MTPDQADKELQSYRSLLRRWNMANLGLNNDYVPSLEQQLADAESTLNEIAMLHPNRADAVVVLLNARARRYKSRPSNNPQGRPRSK